MKEVGECNAATEAVRNQVPFNKSPELSENILIHLPPKTFSGVQRVCLRFNNIIQELPSIQTKMSLHCKRNTQAERWDIDSGEVDPDHLCKINTEGAQLRKLDAAVEIEMVELAVYYIFDKSTLRFTIPVIMFYLSTRFSAKKSVWSQERGDF
jgi:hypothetical protein